MLWVRLDDRDLGVLDSLVKRRGTSRSEVVRRLIGEASFEEFDVIRARRRAAKAANGSGSAGRAIR